MAKELSNYVERYGPVAGTRLYHALKSRAAYKAASTRSRRRIGDLTGRPVRVRRPAAAPAELVLFPEPETAAG